MTDVVGGMLGHYGSRRRKPVQRPAHFVLVDEADSILIDEARTPLIIGALPTEEELIAAECYRWSRRCRAAIRAKTTITNSTTISKRSN